MKSILAVAFTLATICSLSARAQDAVKVSPDHYKIKLENENVRVIENVLAPGEKDPTHTHPAGWYYVTKPGTMKIVHADGKSEIWEAKKTKPAGSKPKARTPPKTSVKPP